MHDLTKGSLARNLIKTSAFMLVGMIFQTMYFLVDLYFVGRLGKTAVATALVSHATGRKDRDEARLVFNQSQVPRC